MRRQEDEPKEQRSRANPHPNGKPAANQPTNPAYVSPWRTAQRWLSFYLTPTPSAPAQRTWYLPTRHSQPHPDQLQPAALHRAQGCSLAHYLASDPKLPPIRWIQLAGKLCQLAVETQFALTFSLQTIRYDDISENLRCPQGICEPLTTTTFTQLVAQLLGFALHEANILITAKTQNRLHSRELCETLQAFLQKKLAVITPLQSTYQDFIDCFDASALQCADILSAIRKVALVDMTELQPQTCSTMVNALYQGLQAADQVILIDLHGSHQNEYALLEKKLREAGVKYTHKIIFSKNTHAKLETILLKLSQIPHLGNGDPLHYFFLTTQFFSEAWINHLKRQNLSILSIDLHFKKSDYVMLMKNEIMLRRSHFLIHSQIRYVRNELCAEAQLIQSAYLENTAPLLVRESAQANLDTILYTINQLDKLLLGKKTSFDELMAIIGPLTPIILHRMNKIMQLLIEQRPSATFTR